MKQSTVALTPPEKRSSSGIAEVARRRDISKKLVRNQIKSGKLRAKRVGRRILISAEAEQAWWDAAPDATAGQALTDDTHPTKSQALTRFKSLALTQDSTKAAGEIRFKATTGKKLSLPAALPTPKQ